jgi:hypothetical protein
VGLITCGDLSLARTAFFIPPGCFNTAFGGLAEGVGLIACGDLSLAGFACLALLGSNRGMLIAAFGLHPCWADRWSVCAAARRSHP